MRNNLAQSQLIETLAREQGGEPFARTHKPIKADENMAESQILELDVITRLEDPLLDQSSSKLDESHTFQKSKKERRGKNERKGSLHNNNLLLEMQIAPGTNETELDNPMSLSEL